MPNMDSRFLEYFWSKVNKTNSCWLWTGWISGDGYGKIWNRLVRKSIFAHRISWMLSQGEIADGKFVLHHCDVRACVNPSHLFLGTQADNMADMDRKGRRVKGEKVTELQVAEMRHERNTLKTAYRPLASKYGISYQAAWLICNRKCYAKVP